MVPMGHGWCSFLEKENLATLSKHISWMCLLRVASDLNLGSFSVPIKFWGIRSNASCSARVGKWKLPDVFERIFFTLVLETKHFPSVLLNMWLFATSAQDKELQWGILKRWTSCHHYKASRNAFLPTFSLPCLPLSFCVPLTVKQA